MDDDRSYTGGYDVVGATRPIQQPTPTELLPRSGPRAPLRAAGCEPGVTRTHVHVPLHRATGRPLDHSRHVRFRLPPWLYGGRHAPEPSWRKEAPGPG